MKNCESGAAMGQPAYRFAPEEPHIVAKFERLNAFMAPEERHMCRQRPRPRTLFAPEERHVCSSVEPPNTFFAQFAHEKRPPCRPATDSHCLMANMGTL
jgi:hypothetical protein